MKLLRLNDDDTPKEYKIRGAQDYLCVDTDSGIYWVDIYRADKTPNRLRQSTRTKNKELAKKVSEDIIAKWLGHRADGSNIRILFSQVCDETLLRLEGKLAAKRIRSGTLVNAKHSLGKDKILRNEFGHLFVDQITTAGTWGGFVARFQKEREGKTLYNHWKHMVMAMKHAHRAGYIERPWEVENPDPQKKTGRILTEDEKTELLNVAPPILRDQLIMAMTMGMRLREILKLEWNRVDFDACTITLRVDDTKTKKSRTMRMTPQALSALRLRKAGKFRACDGYFKRIKNPSERYVFPSPKDRQKPMNQNKTAWRTAKKNAKITDRCRFHDMRHTFLTECAKLVREGHVSVVLICSYAGLSIKTFERVYLHLTHEDTAPVANLIVVKLPELSLSTGVIH